ncbi:MAG: hypothetical protein DME05_15205 [Candidatus Rokuibacteriota bacterium]|nr:MAG: hypothetical protein DME05_15205 [Candidatus Rokubacteria bacterium]
MEELRSELAGRQRDAVEVVLPPRIGDVAKLVGDALVIVASAVDLDAAVRVSAPAAQMWRTSPM